MTEDKKCPECGYKIALLPIREPIPDSMVGATTFTGEVNQTINFPYQPQYGPTMKIYKCINEKCWVTKITESWE